MSENKVWLLNREDGLCSYDEVHAFVIRAKTAEEAREIAQSKGADEVRYRGFSWCNPNHASCVELTGVGDEGVIVRDFDTGESKWCGP